MTPTPKPARERGARRNWRQPSWQKLTPTETVVIDYLIQGLSNAEIAALMAVSYKAVDQHLRNIYSKLNVNSRLQAALKWQAYRLVGKTPYEYPDILRASETI